MADVKKTGKVSFLKRFNRKDLKCLNLGFILSFVRPTDVTQIVDILQLTVDIVSLLLIVWSAQTVKGKAPNSEQKSKEEDDT